MVFWKSIIAKNVQIFMQFADFTDKVTQKVRGMLVTIANLLSNFHIYTSFIKKDFELLRIENLKKDVFLISFLESIKAACAVIIICLIVSS